MKKNLRTYYALFALVVGVFFAMASCRSVAPASSPLASVAQDPTFTTDTVRQGPTPPSDEIVAVLKSKKEKGQTDHLGLLVEYGLRVHWHYLKHTGLARELPTESNMLLSELVRIAEIPQFTTAHEAGWLNRQFYGPFNRSGRTGWSSYQIYVWVKEHVSMILSDDKRFPNSKRIGELMEKIDNSDLNGIGGGGVCHYGCR